MTSRILRALKTHRSALPWLLLQKSLARFIRIETLVLYRQDLARSRHVPDTADSPLLVCRVEEPASEIFGILCARYPNRNFYQRLQHEGRQCFVAMHDDRIAGYAWVAEGSVYVDEIARSYSIAPDEIFIYDCFVDSEFRGMGIYPRVLATVLQDNHNRNGNLKVASIAASSVNQASIRGILKAGFVELKRIRYVEYCRKQKWWGVA